MDFADEIKSNINLSASPVMNMEFGDVYSSPKISHVPISRSGLSSPSDEPMNESKSFMNDQYSDVDEDLDANNENGDEIIDYSLCHIDHSPMHFVSHDYQHEGQDVLPPAWQELQHMNTPSETSPSINSAIKYESQSPLPSNWVKCSTIEGWTYYYDTLSGVSTWDAADTITLSSESEIMSQPIENSYDKSLNKDGMNEIVPANPNLNHFTENFREEEQHYFVESTKTSGDPNTLLTSPMHANVDLVNDNGLTALQIVCQQSFTSSKQQMDCAIMLIESGARVNVYDNNGNSLLHYAVRSSNAQLVKYLLVQGADSDKLNNEGDSAVHVAAKLGNLECMQVLVLFRGGPLGEMNNNQKGESEWTWQEELDSNEAELNYDFGKEIGRERARTQELNNFNSSAMSALREKKREKMHTFRQHQETSNGGHHSDSRMQYSDTFHDTSEHRDEPIAADGLRHKLDNLQGWIECFSPEGARYYYNEFSKRVQWENPFSVSNPAQDDHTFQPAGRHSSRTINSARSNSQFSTQQNTTYEQSQQIEYNDLNHYHQPQNEFQPRRHEQQTTKKSLHHRNARSRSTSLSSASSATLSIFENNAPKGRSISQRTIPSDQFTSDNKIEEECSTSPSDLVPSDGETNNQRHLRVWSRVFVNAVRRREDDDAMLPEADLPTSKSPNKVRNRNQRKRSEETSYNDWPPAITESDYQRLVSAVTHAEGSEVDEFLRSAKNNEFESLSNIALLHAVIRGDVKAAGQLLSLGIDPTERVDIKLRSPAHFASKLTDSTMLALLLDYGADADIVDIDRSSPLHVAAFFGCEEALRCLLENAVTVDRPDAWDNTALHLAVHSRNVACCKSLLEYGAKISHRNRMGLNAAKCAELLEPRTSEVIEILELLSSRDTKSTPTSPIDPSVLIAHGGIPESKSILSRLVPHLSAVGSQGEMPMHAMSWPLNNDTLTTSLPRTTTKPLMLRIDTTGRPPPIETQFLVSHLASQTIPRAMPLPVPPPSSYYEFQPNAQNSSNEQDHEEGNEGVPDKLAGAVWKIASSLMNVAFSAFGSDNTDQGKSPLGDEGKDDLDNWKNSSAPPTDAQLFNRGLGFRVRQPPAIVADEINAHAFALRTGLTPRRSHMAAPDAVVAAVEEKRLMQARRA